MTNHRADTTPARLLLSSTLPSPYELNSTHSRAESAVQLLSKRLVMESQIMTSSSYLSPSSGTLERISTFHQWPGQNKDYQGA